jgi:hypothetical protein
MASDKRTRSLTCAVCTQPIETTSQFVVVRRDRFHAGCYLELTQSAAVTCEICSTGIRNVRELAVRAGGHAVHRICALKTGSELAAPPDADSSGARQNANQPARPATRARKCARCRGPIDDRLVVFEHGAFIHLECWQTAT